MTGVTSNRSVLWVLMVDLQRRRRFKEKKHTKQQRAQETTGQEVSTKQEARNKSATMLYAHFRNSTSLGATAAAHHTTSHTNTQHNRPHSYLVALLVCALAGLCGLVGWVVLAQLCVAVGLGALQQGVLGGLQVLGLALLLFLLFFVIFVIYFSSDDGEMAQERQQNQNRY